MTHLVHTILYRIWLFSVEYIVSSVISLSISEVFRQIHLVQEDKLKQILILDALVLTMF